METLQELEAFLQASEYGEFAAERVLTEEEIKDGRVVPFLAFPVRVRHRDLVEI